MDFDKSRQKCWEKNKNEMLYWAAKLDEQFCKLPFIIYHYLILNDNLNF